MEIIDLIQDKIKESQVFDLLNHISLVMSDVNTSDSDMVLLNVVSELLENGDIDTLLGKLPNFSEDQLNILYNAIINCNNSYFKSKDELITFLNNFFTLQEIMYFDIDNLTDLDLSDINKIFVDTEISANNVNIYDIETNDELLENIKNSIISYFENKNMIDKDFIDNVESASITRDIMDNDAILESDNISDKIKKLEEMDDQSIAFLYSMFTGNYTSQYSQYMRSDLTQELIKHPDGEISRYLSPLSQTQQDELLSNNGSSQSEIDQFWQSMKDVYGTKINENLLVLYTKLFPINECRRLLTSLSNINVVKGINENYYIVSGKNLNNIKLLK